MPSYIHVRPTQSRPGGRAAPPPAVYARPEAEESDARPPPVRSGPPSGPDGEEAATGDGPIVARAAQGDAAAMEELMSRYRGAALRVAMSQVRHREDAEDVCQEALATAAARIGECRQPDRFVGWLLRIVRNHAISLLRRRRVRQGVPLHAVGEVHGREDPERDLERAELRQQMQLALQTLTPLQRQVAILYDLEGWRHAEIAAHLGTTEGSSRVHLHNARRALRARLEAIYSDGAQPEPEAACA